MKKQIINIIGSGLAGSEAGYQAAKLGFEVVLWEMRPQKMTPAHQTSLPAELVCSNSFRSDDFEYNAVGLLHQELRMLDSLIMKAADETKVPAGGALAVDRVRFSEYVKEKLENEPNISLKNKELEELPIESAEPYIIATGPLTSKALIDSIIKATGEDNFNFFDAIAPIVYKDSIDMNIAWYQSRYDKGDKFDYINCPLNKEQYYNFVEELVSAQKADFHDWEKENKTKYFDGCLPIEIMAQRGKDTLAFGPMKPVGLSNPKKPNERPFAVIQLRQDNKEDTLRNIVGFQTKLKHSEQKRIFKTIPGLEKAEFARLGGIHQNSFINSPKILDSSLRLKSHPHIYFAGQITGCEGYIESASVGLAAAYFAAKNLLSKNIEPFPQTTAIGSMINHITSQKAEDFQPMNINFGIMPNQEGKRLKGRDKKKMTAKIAIEDLQNWLGGLSF